MPRAVLPRRSRRNSRRENAVDSYVDGLLAQCSDYGLNETDGTPTAGYTAKLVQSRSVGITLADCFDRDRIPAYDGSTG